MPRPRTSQVVYAEIVDLLYERRQKCYLGGTPSGTCINEPEWTRISAQIERLEAEAKKLEATEAA